MGGLGRALEVSSAGVRAKPGMGGGRRLILLQGAPSSPPDSPL